MNRITLFIVAVLLFGGSSYFLYQNRHKYLVRTSPPPVSISATPVATVKPAPTEPVPTAVKAPDKTAVPEITDSFYKSYDSCMKNPPAKAAGKVSQYCQDNSGLTTAAFASNLEKGGTAKAGADPIFCAQNIPESFNVSPDARISGDSADIFVSEKFGPSEIKIKADLIRENGAWKIDNIICPRP